jgi:hypothetical protein
VKSSVLPLVDTLLKNSDWSPLFVAVIVCAVLVVPTSCDANVSDAGANETVADADAGIVIAPTVANETASTGSNRSSRIVWTPFCQPGRFVRRGRLRA